MLPSPEADRGSPPPPHAVEHGAGAAAPCGVRVALFSGNFDYNLDGASLALNRVAARMRERGMVVRVFSPVGDRPAFKAEAEIVPVPSFALPFRPEYRVAIGLPWTTRRAVEAFDPDIAILTVPDWLGHSAKRWAKARGLPVVATVHTRFETYFDYYGLGRMRDWAENVLRRFYGDLDGVFAPSESMARVLSDGGYSDRVEIWSRGVDRTLFNPERRDLGWRAGLGFEAEDFVALFVGRLVKEKALDMLAAIANKTGPRVGWLVVGDGPERRELEDAMPFARFAGFLQAKELARAYASADAFVNPSVTETFGNVTLEAMASGLPVVAASAPGAASLVDDGVTGRLVPPRDVGAWSDVLGWWAADRQAARMLGRRGCERASAFDWDKVNDGLIDRLASLVRQPSAQALR